MKRYKWIRLKKLESRSFWCNCECHLRRSLDKILASCMYCCSSSTLSLSLFMLASYDGQWEPFLYIVDMQWSPLSLSMLASYDLPMGAFSFTVQTFNGLLAFFSIFFRPSTVSLPVLSLFFILQTLNGLLAFSFYLFSLKHSNKEEMVI